jgi:hypothetical protein
MFPVAAEPSLPTSTKSTCSLDSRGRHLPERGKEEGKLQT